MRFVKPYSTTYNADTKEQDNFSRFILIAPCFILALCFNYEQKLSFDWPVIQEILWTFSIYLEAVAIFPQMLVLQRTGKVQNLTANYVFTLGCYRGLYVLNWIYRYLTLFVYRQWIVWISGVVQTALYIDFFIHYYRAKSAAGIGADVVISGSEV
jgi:ER lumen protein retaining receptor